MCGMQTHLNIYSVIKQKAQVPVRGVSSIDTFLSHGFIFISTNTFFSLLYKVHIIKPVVKTFHHAIILFCYFSKAFSVKSMGYTVFCGIYEICLWSST